MYRTGLRFAACLILIALAPPAIVAEYAALEPIVPSDYLVLPAVGEYGRLPLHRDAVEAQLVAGTWKNPSKGDAIEGPNGERETWNAATATDGTLDVQSKRGGYAFTTFDAPADGVMMLEASGHAAVYVNGEPHTGDPYKLGWLHLPVRVQKGTNTLLFHLAADKLSARLAAPPADVFFMDEDRTLPTLVRDETRRVWAAVPIVNATVGWLDRVYLSGNQEGDEGVRMAQQPIPPLSVFKGGLLLNVEDELAEERERYRIQLTDHVKRSAVDAKTLAKTAVELKVVDHQDIHIRTFITGGPHSTQSYAVRPADKATTASRDAPGIIVTLHDAGVTCEEQIAQYSSKPWAHVIAPQGRRPYGFDWEAWSRSDALEALADAEETYPSNRRRTYLTGDSMGGHGAWHLGVTYPDKFAAVGPNAGWISFWSYGGGMPSFDNPTEIEAMILRGYAPSDTLKLLTNLTNTGVYVQHDPAEEEVPVEQARFLREELAAFHPNFVYYEAADSADESDNDNDVSRMMEFFEHSQRPEPGEQTFIDFTTSNPGVSAECDWVIVDAQQEQLVPSRVKVRQDHEARAFVGETTNVGRLAIKVGHLPPAKPIDVTVDDQAFTALPWPDDGDKLWFERNEEKWSAAPTPSPKLKNRKRYGTFNAVIHDDVLLVYGTQGDEAENRWAEAKARLDAETFYYRAGGQMFVLPDDKFSFDPESKQSVILYGNADTNAAWAELLPDCPVEVNRGQVRVGERTESGDDLAVMMVRPRPGSDTALVGVVGGTGSAGMRLTNRLRWYVSGITYPDLMILGPKILTEGNSDVRAWGYFADDWGIDDAEIAWREVAP